MSYVSVLTKTIDLKIAGVVDVDVDALQTFSSAPLPYGFQLLIDGTFVFDSGRKTYPGDIIHFGGQKACAAGNRTVEVRWAGDPGITLNACSLKVRGFNNVAG